MHNSGASRRGVAKLRLKSEPSLPATNAKRLRKGALATKQSILLHKERMDCFVAPRAMTVSRRTRHTLNRRRPPPGRRIAPPDDRLQRAIQYSRDADDGVERPRRTGYPACARYDGVVWAAPAPSLRGAERRSNPCFLFAAITIASRSLSSDEHSCDPLARNDDNEWSSAL
jgi:hypothetical protein